ncbi:MAG: FecR domain-containing protein [Desulfococcaceae bacterium]
MAKRYEFFSSFRWRSRLLRGVLWLLWAGTAAAQGGIPEKMVIADSFSPGIGASVGEVSLLQGSAVVVHAEDAGIGYPLSPGDPVFQGDTLFTGEDGKVNVELNDGSRLVLATNTRMTIRRSVYNPDRLKTRNSFIDLILGKARFFVRKIDGLVSSDFKVKTKTAIVGVRGSDFAVEVGEDLTTVTAFEDTQIDLIGLVAPCPRVEEGQRLDECDVTPVRLRDFEQAMVPQGSFPELVGLLDMQQIEGIKEEFFIEDAGGPMTDRPEEPEIRVAESDLSDLAVGAPEVAEETMVPDAFLPGGAGESADETTEVAEGRAEEILEQVQRTDSLETLPGFPGAPR